MPRISSSLGEEETEKALSAPPFPDLASDPLAEHRITEILRPEYPLKRVFQVIDSQPKEVLPLFVSRRHLDLLRVPPENKVFVRVLQNPATGSLVYLIGTVHISKASADDVRMLIEEVKPDIVAIELDPERLARIEGGYFAKIRDDLGTTTWKALYVRWTKYSSFEELWGAYLQMVFFSQVVGTDYGGDMQSAIQTARRLQIPIELIDQISKAYAEHAEKEEQSGQSEMEAADRGYIEGMLKSACDDPTGPVDAFERVFQAFLEGRPVPLEDVAAYRSCSTKVLNKVRRNGFDGADQGLKGRPASVAAAFLDERDDHMGARLAQLAAQPKTTVVAVVGAAHVPGVPSSLGFRVTTGGVAVAAGVAAGALACYKRPRLMRRLGAGGALAGGGIQLGLAALTAKWTQFGAYLDEATRQMEARGTASLTPVPVPDQLFCETGDCFETM
ncbi:hypothetical protein KFL_000110480 [Klebsormidium nitens]|uniref:TraB family protein n=1 Tax=Klebsormidium nitens TaxID=105231 RepID=A0A1Y1HMX9_KLENI|nr:hypothetical protein KFL_000110480 [Klebsormidium nitens]|eukprot:GAQ78351.1 hypothetical protein KFL_000110480 [Klebsormidium nitens]